MQAHNRERQDTLDQTQSQSFRGGARDKSRHDYSNISLLQNADRSHILVTEESKHKPIKHSNSNTSDTSNILGGIVNQSVWQPLPEENKDADENIPDLQAQNQEINQNQNAEEAAIEQHAPVHLTMETQERQTTPEIAAAETQMFYRVKIALFSTFAVSSFFLWMVMNDKHTTHGIIAPFYFYFAYSAIERAIVGYRKPQLDIWYRKESRLEFLGELSCFLAIFFLHLKLAGIISLSIIATIPLLISTVIYPCKSREIKSIKIPKTLIKIAYTLQVFFITLKVDGIINSDWVFILMISLAFFGSIGSLCCIHGGFIFLLAYVVFRQNYRDAILSPRILFLGVFWHFMYYGLAVIGDCIIIGVIAVFDPREGPQLLTISSFISFMFNLFLVVLTLLNYRPLCNFTQNFDWERLLAPEGPESPAQVRPVISFEVEQKNTYFMSLSTTYFLPLTRGFLAKSKPNIEKIKTMFKDSRLGKSISKQQSNKQDIEQNKPVNKQTLQQYKETLDGKLAKALRDRPEKLDNSVSMHKFLKMFSPKAPKLEFMTPRKDLPQNEKISLSLGNIDDLENVYAKPKPSSPQGEDEKLCYLCYSDPPNCVLMNCGHGGFCYECATAAIKRKNECMECRAKVEEVHKIDPESKQFGIIKTIEIMKVVVTNPKPKSKNNLEGNST